MDMVTIYTRTATPSLTVRAPPHTPLEVSSFIPRRDTASAPSSSRLDCQCQRSFSCEPSPLPSRHLRSCRLQPIHRFLSHSAHSPSSDSPCLAPSCTCHHYSPLPLSPCHSRAMADSTLLSSLLHATEFTVVSAPTAFSHDSAKAEQLGPRPLPDVPAASLTAPLACLAYQGNSLHPLVSTEARRGW